MKLCSKTVNGVAVCGRPTNLARCPKHQTWSITRPSLSSMGNTETATETRISGDTSGYPDPALPPSQIRTLEGGQIVKLMFGGEHGTEKMWIALTDKRRFDRWEGKLISVPLHIPLKHGDLVRFHPLDIIEIFEGGY